MNIKRLTQKSYKKIQQDRQYTQSLIRLYIGCEESYKWALCGNIWLRPLIIIYDGEYYYLNGRDNGIDVSPDEYDFAEDIKNGIYKASGIKV